MELSWVEALSVCKLNVLRKLVLPLWPSGGAIASIVLPFLLNDLGLRWTMLIFALILLVLVSIALALVKERVTPDTPIQGSVKRITWVDKQLFSSTVFWALGMNFFFAFL